MVAMSRTSPGIALASKPLSDSAMTMPVASVMRTTRPGRSIFGVAASSSLVTATAEINVRAGLSPALLVSTIRIRASGASGTEARPPTTTPGGSAPTSMGTPNFALVPSLVTSVASVCSKVTACGLPT